MERLMEEKPGYRIPYGNLVLTFMIITFAFFGCATIFTSSKHRILLTSHPDGAQVDVFDHRGHKVGEISRTPAAVTLQYDYTGKPHRFEFKLPSSEAIEVRHLDSTVKNEFWANIFSYMSGGIVDWYLGAMWEPVDISVNATFARDAVQREGVFLKNREIAVKKGAGTENFTNTVRLKDGREFPLVNTIIVGKDLVVTTRKGRTFVFPKKDVKYIIK